MSLSFHRGTIAAACLFLAAGLPQTSQAAPQKRITWHQAILDFDKSIHSSIAAAATSKAPEAQVVLLGVAHVILGFLEDNVTKEAQHGDSVTGEDGLTGALDRMDLAAAYDNVGCRDLARKELLDLYVIYVGSIYESMRERAKIQLDDLKSEPDRPAPKNCPTE